MTSTVGGYDIAQLVASIANDYAGNQAQLSSTAGYYDPYMLGWAAQPGTVAPTLARDQLSAQVNQWGVQNSQNQQQIGLDQSKLDAQVKQWAQQNALDAGTLTGFYNGLPTLAREQLAATIGIANADNFRQWAQMRGSQLLQQQAQDDQMRVAGADARLNTLQLLSSQRGPENFMAYNSLLNSLASPDLTATDPFGIAQRLEAGVPARTPVDLNAAWSSAPPAGGGAVALPNMTAPAGGAANIPAGATSPAPVPVSPSGGAGAGSATGQRTYTPPPSSSGLAISGNPAADAALMAAPASAAGPGWTGADPATLAELQRISGNMNAAYQTQQQNTGGMAGYAGGTPDPMMADGPPATGGMPTVTADTIDWKQYMGHGPQTDKEFVVGDVQRSGQPNPEVLINPTGAPFIVIPMSELSPQDRSTVGMPSMSKPMAAASPMPAMATGTGWGEGWGAPRPDVQLDPMENPGGGWSGMDWQSWRQPGGIEKSIGDYFAANPMVASYLQSRGRPTAAAGATPAAPTAGAGGTGGAATPAPNAATNPAQGSWEQGNGMPLITPFGQAYVNPSDSYWSKLGSDYRQTEGRLPGFATGTGFSTDTPFGDFGTFDNSQLAGSPVVGKLQGTQPSNLWQGFGGDMRLPGTQSQLPLTINMASLARMAPSEQAMVKSIYETPRSMGGLGMYWDDVMNASMRAAPIGQRWSPAGYGYQ